MESLPYVMVAEKSVLPIAGIACQSLYKHAGPASVHIVVPDREVEIFCSTLAGTCTIVPESDLLPEWPLRRIAGMFPPLLSQRAGWYLQQFLKLRFGSWSGLSRYVIWDADTVLLRPLQLMSGERVVMNQAREHHAPYFDTYRALFDRPPVLPKSVISQYMLMDSSVISELFRELEQRHQTNWVEAILRALPGRSFSEFSEYETYGNFLAQRFPGSVLLQKEKWFRYGAEIMARPAERKLPEIERQFSGFAYVAFERHPGSPSKRLLCRGARALGISS